MNEIEIDFDFSLDDKNGNEWIVTGTATGNPIMDGDGVGPDFACCEDWEIESMTLCGGPDDAIRDVHVVGGYLPDFFDQGQQNKLDRYIQEKLDAKATGLRV